MYRFSKFSGITRIMITSPILILLLLAVQSFVREEPQLTVEKIRDNLWVLYGGNGQGANVGMYIGDDGIILIDAMKAETNKALMAAINNISSKPIKYVINTHSDNDHAGGTALLEELGAVSIAQANAPYEGGSASIYFKEVFTLNLGSEEIVVRHAVSHSFSDAIIYFSASNAVFMGDTFTNSWYATYNSGGVPGQLDAIQKALAYSNSSTIVVPGHGLITDQEGLRTYSQKVESWLVELTKQYQAGLGIGEMLAHEELNKIKNSFIDPKTNATIPDNRFQKFINRSISTDLVVAKPVEAGILKRYIGRFQYDDGSIDEIVEEDGKLLLRKGHPSLYIAELVPLSKTKFHIKGGIGEEILFTFNSLHEVQGITHNASDNQRQAAKMQ